MTIDYRDEAADLLINCEDIVELKGAPRFTHTANWLRSFAAKVLREVAGEFEDSDYRWYEISDIIERRAREIEQG